MGFRWGERGGRVFFEFGEYVGVLIYDVFSGVGVVGFLVRFF